MFLPNNEHAIRCTKQVVTDMDSVGYIEKPLVPFIKVTQDRVVLEIQRAVSAGAVLPGRGCVQASQRAQPGISEALCQRHVKEHGP